MKQATPFSAISKCYAYVLKQLGIKKETPTTAPKTSIATLIKTEPRKPILRTDAALLKESSKMITEKRQLDFQPIKRLTHMEALEKSNKRLGIASPYLKEEQRLAMEDRDGSISIQFVRKSK